MNMDRLSAQNRLIAIIAGSIAVFGVVIFLVIRPLIGSLEDAHGNAQGKSNELNRLVVEGNSFKTSAEDLKKIQDRAAEISNLFPIREDLVGLVQSLETAAKQGDSTFSLTITDASENPPPGSAEKSPPPYMIVPKLVNIDVIPYDFRLQGSYISIIHFLQTLEHQPFYSEIEHLILTGRVGQATSADGTPPPRTGIIDASIRSAFYARKDIKK